MHGLKYLMLCHTKGKKGWKYKRSIFENKSPRIFGHLKVCVRSYVRLPSKCAKMPQRNAKKVVLLRHFTIYFQKYHVYFLTFSPDGDRRADARPVRQVVSVSRGCFTKLKFNRVGVLCVHYTTIIRLKINSGRLWCNSRLRFIFIRLRLLYHKFSL